LLISKLLAKLFHRQNAFGFGSSWFSHARQTIAFSSPELMDSCHFFIRKSGYFAEYFVLSILVYRAFLRGHGPLWKWRVAVWTLGVVLLYSVADEVRQTFASNRSGVWSDSVLDFFGGSCAVGLLYARHRRKAGARSPVAVTDPYAN
ncbi:MAG: VanZ family protein, partial [Acidimicrobiia bacterium]|nr:VanZ family protein [Acidimicrobiia bacterium]